MVKVTLVLLRSEGWKDAVVKVTLFCSGRRV